MKAERAPATRHTGPAVDRAADEKFMRLAIAKTVEGIRKGQTPFGACIVLDGRVLSCAHNLVWKTTDITAHAEVAAIRAACRRLRTVNLEGAVIYCTCEPCPMCFAACHWARISRIVYGARIKDALLCAFNELTVSNARMKRLGKSPVAIEGGFLGKECAELFRLWEREGASPPY